MELIEYPSTYKSFRDNGPSLFLPVASLVVSGNVIAHCETIGVTVKPHSGAQFAYKSLT